MDFIGDDRSYEYAESRAQVTGPRIGSRLLKSAFAGDGTLLLLTGKPINSPEQLMRLLQPDVRFGPERSVHMPLDLSNEIRLNAVELERNRIYKTMGDAQRPIAIKQSAVDVVKDVFTAVDAGRNVEVSRARETTNMLVAELQANPGGLVALVQQKNSDAYTYTHCVHVCILTIYLALSTQYEKDIADLGLGALLHDIGKVGIPLLILNKTNQLTASEMKTMMHHPLLGAGLLARSGLTDPIVTSCVLDHHEKMNGTGYPNGKKGDELSAYAKITTLADIYDALTTDRPYRRAMRPAEAITLMTEQMGEAFDPVFLKRFADVIEYIPPDLPPQNINPNKTGSPKDLVPPAEHIDRIFSGFDTLC